MPHFFFDVGDGAGWIRDPAGMALEHRLDVPREAAALVTTLLADGPIEQEQRSIACLVRDDAGRGIYRVSVELSGRWDAVGHRSVTGRGAAPPRDEA